MSKYRLIHDVWNAYSYGGKIKIVYIKSSARRIPHSELLFPELEGLPSSVREDAIRQTISSGNVVAIDSSGVFVCSAPKDSGAKNNATDERLQSSLSRTKSRIFELSMCNEFTHFCTLTLDQNKVGDRFDLDTFRKDFAHFVRNQNRGRITPIKYLLIPEQHKNGAWHLHGFFSGLEESADLIPFKLSDRIPYRLRKMIREGNSVFNWEKYAKKYGFFTATRIKDRYSASAYITKYVTKDVVKQGRESHRHLFFASQGLKGRERIVVDSFDQSGAFCPCPFSDNEWEFENDYVKIKWL